MDFCPCGASPEFTFQLGCVTAVAVCLLAGPVLALYLNGAAQTLPKRVFSNSPTASPSLSLSLFLTSLAAPAVQVSLGFPQIENTGVMHQIVDPFKIPTLCISELETITAV